MSETIFALSSAAGRAGLAVIRLSGPAAGNTLQAFSDRPLPPPRRATRTCLLDPKSGDALDDGMALWFPGPGSYTGEDVVELHVHGGVAVVAALLEALGRWPGLRMAEPGEFTRRAFLSGKIDLTEAEGVIDLIDAETDAQRRQALRQAEGALGRLYDGWRTRLVGLLAHFEASIDFVDEPIPEALESQVRDGILCIAEEIAQHLDDNRRGERLREGVHIAILGAPNVGKSSLLNLLSQRDAAIVSATAGTTRDVVEVRLDLKGYPVTVADTAGLRESGDDIEAEGVRRALARAESADLKIAVFDLSKLLDSTTMDLIDSETIVVFNKSDLAERVAPSPSIDSIAAAPACPISVKTGAGVDGFLQVLTDAVADRTGLTDTPVITRVRHRTALQSCHDALARAAAASESELAAEDLRLAVRALGRITGSVDVEDLLDVIFRDFCIGK
ncbi:MAG: tRNA uridine-5-carboxymethylaminomethyl(34) synthesis GTPase MnmE [Alphaproteobacteria bacterium]|nr:tRNA uridine-5-carboxymethylaminomethyl(34) synthesis GTPase MnmE [Alphaproteobacteria bacterium]